MINQHIEHTMLKDKIYLKQNYVKFYLHVTDSLGSDFRFGPIDLDREHYAKYKALNNIDKTTYLTNLAIFKLRKFQFVAKFTDIGSCSIQGWDGIDEEDIFIDFNFNLEL